MKLKIDSNVKDFIQLGINFVKTCLQEGWKRKAEAAEKIKAEYSK